MREEIRNFMHEMDAGLAGEASSLPMIPTFLGHGSAETDPRPVLVIDAGGTNLRAAVVRFSDAGFEIWKSVKGKMPGREGAIPAAQFFEELVDFIEPLIEDIGLCGFCFSYPAEIRPDHDGRIIAFSKDIEITGAEGILIGESMNAVLARRGKDPLKVCVLNDTVATYFGGCGSTDQAAHGSVIGMILGTGFNSCYMERADRIGKLDGAPHDMAINIESGKFKKVEMRSSDLALDEASALPGDAWMEKKISGAYLGSNVYYALLDRCGDEGALDIAFRSRLLEKGTITTSEISRFTEDPYRDDLGGLCRSDAQREVVLEVADELIDRAAYLVVCHLAAIMEHCEMGRSRHMPATIVAEGTTWQKFAALRKRIIFYAHQIITMEQGRYYRFCEIEGSNLIGSAKAALSCG